MGKFVVVGGTPLSGEFTLQGAKNVALKTFVAALLTDEEVIIHNVPRIRDVHVMLDILHDLGVSSTIEEHTVRLKQTKSQNTSVPLEGGARLRTSALVMGPLLCRTGEAHVPNPGGCRLGARPIDRQIDALQQMGANITYDSNDGYFHATCQRLHGARIHFDKNTHTGTEAVILAAVCAEGETVITNAAQEVEIDDLVLLLNRMGGKIRRSGTEIHIQGVKRMVGAEHTCISDRNEEVTMAIAAAMTKGKITIHKSERAYLQSFLTVFREAGGMIDEVSNDITAYSIGEKVHPTQVTTRPHPGFMTDWQSPWAVFMTQASGVSTIHETVFESRYLYVKQLRKMGAHIKFFSPKVEDPEVYYNFNWDDRRHGAQQGIRITGPTTLHNAVVEVDDIRAGASLILAALSAEGESYLYRAETVDRGYEAIEERLRSVGAHITRVNEDDVG